MSTLTRFQQMSRATFRTALALSVLLLSASTMLNAQDTRTVNEPTFPATCTAIPAQQAILNGEPTSETTFDTTAIQTALNACAVGKAVELTTGGTGGVNNAFLIAPINIPTGVTLLVDGGVTVFASRNPADYQVTGGTVETCGTVGTAGNGCNPLISVNGNATSTGAGIMGYGIINGRGGDKLLVKGVTQTFSWWDLANQANTGNAAQNNPIMLLAKKASNFTLYKITFLNSPMFHVKYQNATGFTVWGMKIVAPYTARNTDGIDPTDNVSNITINNSYLSDGDDMVAVGANGIGNSASNISVINTDMYSGHGISIGSYTSGGVSNMLVNNVNMAGNVSDTNSGGLKIKSSQDRGGLVNNVQYTNVCVQNTRYPLQFNPIYNANTGTLIPQYTNIGLHNVTVTGNTNQNFGQLQFQGLDVNHPLGITFDNLNVLNFFQATPKPQYANITLGPGPVNPTFLQSLSGPGITYSGNITNPSEARYNCPATNFPFLAGELYLSTPTLNNQRSLSLPNPATFTLNAVVETVEAASTTPSSPIQFYEGKNQVGTATLSGNGTLASLTLSGVSSGAHTYTARYPADAAYAVLNFGSVTVNVNTTATTTTMTASPTAALYGASVTLTATVAQAAGTVIPGGTVSFQSGGTVIGTATVNASGIATLVTTTLPVGNNSVSAFYGGSTNFAASDSSATPVNVAIGQAGTSTAVAANPTAAVYGSTITITGTVTSATSGTPTGTVTFMDGSTIVDSAILTNGVATITTTTLSTGIHKITAVYGGDSNFIGSTSQTSAQVTIFTATTTTTLGFTSGSVTFGTPVTMIGAVNNGSATSATGTIKFTDGVTTLGVVPIPVGTSSASLTISTLSVGQHNIVATYSGDSNYTGSISSATPLQITQASTSTALAASSATITYGSSDGFTATVSPTTSGTPTGNVTFKDGATVLGTQALTAGSATFSTSALTGGTHSITAIYAGDTNFAGSTSAAIAVTVTTAASTTTVTVPAPITYGNTALLSASVSSTVAGTLTGSVTFKDGTTVLGTGTVSNGTATYTASGLTGGVHNITAVYSGDINFATSTSTSAALTVNKASTSSTVAANPATVSYSSPTTLTASVTPAAATGTFTFLDGGVSIGTGTIVNGVATLTTSALSTGVHSITTTYSGDGNYATSTSASAATVTVTQITSTTTLTASPATTTYLSSTTLTATVPAGATGQVTFKDGATTIGTANVISGKANLTISTLTGGSHSITAVYAGDTNYTGSTSSAVTVQVNLATNVATVVATPATIAFGSSTSLTATLANTTGTGTITFLDGATTLGTVTIANGSATYVASGLNGGTHTITAVYSGDTNFATSTSAAVKVTVTAVATTTSVVASPSTITFGGSTTLTASIVNSAATGSVLFKDGATTVGTGTVNNGVATATVSGLAGGSHNITAIYSGDTNYATSTSPAIVVTVTTAATSTSVAANPAATTFGTSVTLSASVLPTGGTPTQSGTVTFNDGSTVLGTAPVANGGATFTLSTLSTGVHNITATYSGDGNYAASTSTAISVTVGQVVSTIAVTAAPSTITFGNSTTLTATVSPASASGSVTFTDSINGPLGQATVVNGVATLKVSSLTGGNHSIVASYGGDTNDASATSAPTVVTVNLLPTSTALTAAPTALNFGNATTLTATVGPTGVTGSVAFKDGATLIGTGTASAGVATLTVSTLAVGAHSITATYLGDANNAPSTSAAVTVTVALGPTTTSISATPASGTFGSPTSITVTVAPSTATGTVTIKDGNTVLGTPTVSGGVATISVNLSTGAHSLSASYSGDANFAPSATTTSVTVIISVANSTVSAAATPGTVPFGSATTLSASVTPVAATGTVTFRDTGTGLPLGTATIVNGTASLAGVVLSPGGPHGITATYSGDANDGGAISPAITVTVTPGPTVVTLANTPASPVTYGTKITFSTTNTLLLGVAPTGTMQFFDGSTSLGTAPVTIDSVNGPVSSFPYALLAPGTHSITAVYSGDANYGTSTSAAVSITVTQSNSTTTLIATPSQTVPGQSFTLTATAASVTTGTPTGTVTFFDQNNVNLGTVALVNGSASITHTLRTLGTFTYTATYSGDVDFQPSSSTATPTSVIVKQLSTTTAITATPTSGTFGTGTYSFSAVVTPISGGPATGSVTFKDGTTILGTSPLSGNQTASLGGISLAGGVHTIIALYSGDTIYTSSDTSAAPAVITVSTAPSATSLTATPATSTFGTSITFSSAVSSTTQTVATGTVTFMNGAAVLGSGTLNASGIASFTTATLPVGVYNVTAVYSGDTNFAASTSAAVAVTVNQIPQTITVSGIPSTLTYGALPFVITNSASSGLAVTLAVSGPATLNGSTLTITGAGVVTVTATQAGNTTYAAAPTVTSTITVAKAALTVTVANQTIAYGSPIPIITGTVTGVVNGDNISASFSTTATASSVPGTYPITATLVDPNNRLANYTVTNAGATLTISATAQTITFPALPPTVVYGAAPVTLTASSTSNLAIVYTVTGPATVTGNKLTFTGAGTVVVTATQPGNSIYTAATAVSQTITVTKAPLTVTVANQTIKAGAPIPTLTGTLTGVVNGDNITATYSTTALNSNTPGTFPITATLVDPTNRLANYTLTNTAGTLTITVSAQTITFPAIPTSVVYGAAPVTLKATSDSGLAVVYTVTGPASVTGSVLTFTGAGTVVVTATQPGNVQFNAATSVSQTVTVNKAPLTVTVAPQTIIAGAAIPTLTGTITGLVNGDVITATYATTALNSNTPGVFPITATLVDASNRLGNYTVTNTPGTLTITINAQTITFPALPATVVYGATPITVAATSTSNLPVTFTVTGPATLTGSTLTFNGAGTVVVTASQAGNSIYSAATPVSQTITVSKAPLTLVVANKTSLVGQVLPTLTGVLTGVVNGDNITVTYATTATVTSGAGTYPITGTLVDPANKLANYTVTNTPGTLTISIATTTVTLGLSATTVAVGSPVTMTATVASPGGPPTSGTVTFLNGATTLGTGTVNATGIATLTLNNLPAGVYTVTASFAATANYSASTSAAQTLTVVAPVALSLSPSSLSLAAGATGTSTLTLNPGGGFTGAVTLTCASPVAYISCAVTSPVTIAGTTPGTATVTINVAATYGSLSVPQLGPERGPAAAVYAVMLPFGALLLLPLIRRRKLMTQKGFRLLALMLIAVGASLAITGCSGGGNAAPHLPPAGAQVVTITATANGVATTTTLTVNVTN